jgi:hypothetical protein
MGNGHVALLSAGMSSFAPATGPVWAYSMNRSWNWQKSVSHGYLAASHCLKLPSKLKKIMPAIGPLSIKLSSPP